jgi:hypothetical protein
VTAISALLKTRVTIAGALSTRILSPRRWPYASLVAITDPAQARLPGKLKPHCTAPRSFLPPERSVGHELTSPLGHSRPGRASNKSGHVGYTPEAKVIQSIGFIIEAPAAAQWRRFPDGKLFIVRLPPCARAAQRCCAAQAAGAILTTSEAETDVVKCFELQANSYLLKPMDLSAFEVLVKSVNDFWLTKSRLPQQMRK